MFDLESATKYYSQGFNVAVKGNFQLTYRVVPNSSEGLIMSYVFTTKGFDNKFSKVLHSDINKTQQEMLDTCNSFVESLSTNL